MVTKETYNKGSRDPISVDIMVKDGLDDMYASRDTLVEIPSVDDILDLESLIKATFSRGDMDDIGNSIVDEIMGWQYVIERMDDMIPLSEYMGDFDFEDGEFYIKPYKMSDQVPRVLVGLTAQRLWGITGDYDERRMRRGYEIKEMVTAYFQKRRTLMRIRQFWRDVNDQAPEVMEFFEKHGPDYKLLFSEKYACLDI